MNDLPNTMQAVLLTGHGDFDKLVIKDDVPLPPVNANDVLIKISAAAVNNTDINTRIGWYSKSNQSDDASWGGKPLTFPRIQGIDMCGDIVAVGNNVDINRIGERVLVEPCIRYYQEQKLTDAYFIGSECDGGFAQYVAIPSVHSYQINSDLNDTALASFPCSYSTAENMLEKANVNTNDTVLISGASGGVGSAAVQLAKRRGAYVITISSAQKRQAIKTFGADKMLSREAVLVKELGLNSVDVVIDLVAGDQWMQFLEVLKIGGRYAVAGAIGGAMVNLDIRTLYLKDLSFFGCTRLAKHVFQNLIGYIERNEIKPLVDHTYPLTEIIKAQQAFLSKQYVGKIVLTVNH